MCMSDCVDFCKEPTNHSMVETMKFLEWLYKEYERINFFPFCWSPYDWNLPLCAHYNSPHLET